MPIPINIKDNISNIKVKTSSNQEKVHLRKWSNIDVKGLEALINAETEERIDVDDNAC